MGIAPLSKVNRMTSDSLYSWLDDRIVCTIWLQNRESVLAFVLMWTAYISAYKYHQYHTIQPEAPSSAVRLQKPLTETGCTFTFHPYLPVIYSFYNCGQNKSKKANTVGSGSCLAGGCCLLPLRAPQWK